MALKDWAGTLILGESIRMPEYDGLYPKAGDTVELIANKTTITARVRSGFVGMPGLDKAKFKLSPFDVLESDFYKTSTPKLDVRLTLYKEDGRLVLIFIWRDNGVITSSGIHTGQSGGG